MRYKHLCQAQSVLGNLAFASSSTEQNTDNEQLISPSTWLPEKRFLYAWTEGLLSNQLPCSCAGSLLKLGDIRRYILERYGEIRKMFRIKKLIALVRTRRQLKKSNLNDICRFSRDHVVECSERTVLSCLEPACLCWRRFGRYFSHHLAKNGRNLEFSPEGRW